MNVRQVRLHVGGMRPARKTASPLGAAYTKDVADVKVAQRFRLALEMYEFGERMYRAGLHRRHPDASEEAIRGMVQAWRESRPGAPSGDAAGLASRRFA